MSPPKFFFRWSLPKYIVGDIFVRERRIEKKQIVKDCERIGKENKEQKKCETDRKEERN